MTVKILHWRPFRYDHSVSALCVQALLNSHLNDGQSPVDGLQVLSRQNGVEGISPHALV